MLSCLISQVHGIVSKEHAERKCDRKKHTIETILQPYQHSDATRQAAMERGESSRSKDMSGINAFVSDDINNDFCHLDDTTDDDYQKDGIHMKSLSYKTCKACDCVLYHQKYWLKVKLV